MACCPNGTNCNKVVTIGYLKNFIGSQIQKSDGSTFHITYADDTYCPTYAELTGGTIVPNYKAGDFPKNNIDGISIAGNYTNKQLVNQEHVTLMVTRFNNISISNLPEQNLDACNDTWPLSLSCIYTLYINYPNGSNDCTISTTQTPIYGYDIDDIILYTSSFGELSGASTTQQSGTLIFKVGKNGSVSSTTRSTTISASTHFRDTAYGTPSYTITQWYLEGWYEPFVESGITTTYDSFTISPKTFDCSGGIASGTGEYSTIEWTKKAWIDECGVVYPDITKTISGTSTTHQEVTTYAVSSRACDPNSDYDSGNIVKTWHGLSDSYRQICPKCPTACTCDLFTLYNTRVEWDADSVAQKTISYTTDACITNIRLGGLNYYTATLNSGNITVRPNSVNTSQTPIEETLTINYSADGSSCSSAVTLYQKAISCTPSTCTCYLVSDATADTVSSTATSAVVTWVYSAITWTTAATCDVSSAITEISTASDTVYFEASTCDDYYKYGNFTWGGHYQCDGTGCGNSVVTVYWYLNQERPAGCDCYCEAITATPRTWSASQYGSNVSAEVLKIAECCTIVTGNTDNNFTVTTAKTGGYNYVYAYPNSQNTSLTTDRTSTVSVTATCGNNTCPVETVEIRHSHSALTPCNCSDFSITTSTMSFDADGYMIGNGISYTAATCDGVWGVSGDSNILSCGLTGNRITATSVSNDSYTVTKTANIVITLNGAACTGKMITGTIGVKECDCDTFSADTMNNIEFSADEYGIGDAVIYNYSGGSCLTYEAINTNIGDFTVSASNGKLTIYPNSVNTSYTNPKTGVVTFNVMNGNTKCTGITFTVRQTTLPCDCTALRLSTNSVTLDAGASTSVTYTADCVNITSIVASNNNITIGTGTTGVISITANTSGNTIITINSTADGASCSSKTITVTVNCPTITITPTDGYMPCDGGTITFTV